MLKQPFRMLPTTALGKWSLGLIIAMPILFITGTSFVGTLYQNVPSGETILQDIAARPALALTMLAGMAVGISAFITGLLAVLRKKDHALMVYVATAVGGFLVVFLVGEVLFPH